jgi:hypothetical protein
MKKILFLLLTITIGAVIISSCTDNATNNPDTTRDIFPSKVGTYWLYHRDYKEGTETKTAVDSVIIEGTETKQGKTADKYSVYTAGANTEIYYRYTENSKLYALPSELLPLEIVSLLPSGVLPLNWVVIADDKSNSWEMFSIDVNDVPLNIGGSTANLKGVIKVTGVKGGTSNFTVDSKTYTATEFTTKITYTGKVTMGLITTDLPFEVVTKAYFADKIGLIKSETAEQVISFSGIPLYTIQPTSRLLHHFHIK